MEQKKKQQLELYAAKIRKTALETVRTARSGHIGGSFSMAEILAVLYFDQMKVDVKNPNWEDRDRFVLSKGHCTPSAYSALAIKGFFPMDDLNGFRKITSRLSGHMEIHVPGVDMSTGSLGQGLSVAAGIALYGKSNKEDYRVFCVMGDGEIQEGQIWEAAMAASYYKLDHLIGIVDNNQLQLDGSLEEVMSPYPIKDKFLSFGWNVIMVDGNDVVQVSEAIEKASIYDGNPTVIVAKTIKGKGVSVFEGQVRFHGGFPSDAEFEIAFNEINHCIAKLEDSV